MHGRCLSEIGVSSRTDPKESTYSLFLLPSSRVTSLVLIECHLSCSHQWWHSVSEIRVKCPLSLESKLLSRFMTSQLSTSLYQLCNVWLVNSHKIWGIYSHRVLSLNIFCGNLLARQKVEGIYSQGGSHKVTSKLQYTQPRSWTRKAFLTKADSHAFLKNSYPWIQYLKLESWYLLIFLNFLFFFWFSKLYAS